MPLRMPRRSLLCNERKLALLPLPSSFERGREKRSCKMPVGVQLGQHQEEPELLTGDTHSGRGIYPCRYFLFFWETQRVICLFLFSLPQKRSMYWHTNSAFSNVCSIWSVQEMSFKMDPAKFRQSLFSLLRFQELKLLIKNLSVGNETIDLSAFCWTIKP